MNFRFLLSTFVGFTLVSSTLSAQGNRTAYYKLRNILESGTNQCLNWDGANINFKPCDEASAFQVITEGQAPAYASDVRIPASFGKGSNSYLNLSNTTNVTVANKGDGSLRKVGISNGKAVWDFTYPTTAGIRCIKNASAGPLVGLKDLKKPFDQNGCAGFELVALSNTARGR